MDTYPPHFGPLARSVISAWLLADALDVQFELKLSSGLLRNVQLYLIFPLQKTKLKAIPIYGTDY